jgi:hypothetical protein
MTWFHIGFPALMIVLPALFTLLWCLWTGVRGTRPLLLATLVVLLGFGASAYVADPAHRAHYMGWAMGGFWLLSLGFTMPLMRRASLNWPALPRGASLKPRRVELFRGAFVWPLVAWAVVAAVTLIAAGDRPLAWLNPALSLAMLLFLPRWMRALVAEPEPLGGADPAGLAKRYEAFRRQRVRIAYGLAVTLALFLAGGWIALPARTGAWAGALGGSALGLWGALYGTWADAQRYLLRRELSGADPPPR